MGGQTGGGPSGGGEAMMPTLDGGLVQDGGVSTPDTMAVDAGDNSQSEDAFVVVSIDSGTKDAGVSQTTGSGASDSSGCSCRSGSDDHSALPLALMGIFGLLRRRFLRR